MLGLQLGLAQLLFINNDVAWLRYMLNIVPSSTNVLK